MSRFANWWVRRKRYEMEFVIKRSLPEPAVAVGLGRTFVITPTEIRDENGLLLGRVERRAPPPANPLHPEAIDFALWQQGVVTAVFTRGVSSRPAFWFTYDNQTMRVHPLNHYVCDEIHARTELPWFPPGQCKYLIDDCVDPVSALFLFQMLENIDDETTE